MVIVVAVATASGGQIKLIKNKYVVNISHRSSLEANTTYKL